MPRWTFGARLGVAVANLCSGERARPAGRHRQLGRVQGARLGDQLGTSDRAFYLAAVDRGSRVTRGDSRH